MEIQSADLMPFLEEFASLSSTQQRVFLYCLANFPRVVLFTDDIRRIALHMGRHPRSIQRALRVIRRKEILSRCICIVNYNFKEELFYDLREKQNENQTPTDL